MGCCPDRGLPYEFSPFSTIALIEFMWQTNFIPVISNSASFCNDVRLIRLHHHHGLRLRYPAPGTHHSLLSRGLRELRNPLKSTIARVDAVWRISTEASPARISVLLANSVEVVLEMQGFSRLVIPYLDHSLMSRIGKEIRVCSVIFLRPRSTAGKPLSLLSTIHLSPCSFKACDYRVEIRISSWSTSLSQGLHARRRHRATLQVSKSTSLRPYLSHFSLLSFTLDILNFSNSSIIRYQSPSSRAKTKTHLNHRPISDMDAQQFIDSRKDRKVACRKHE